MKNFRYFLNESINPIQYSDDVLQILKQGSINLITNKLQKDSIIKKLNKKIYDKYCIIVTLNKDGDGYEKDKPELKGNTNRQNEIDFSKPIMNMTNIDTFISTDERADLYNKVEDFKLADSKILFTKTFADQNFIPKTVFSLDNIKELSLPIIAKPNSGSSAQGIEKFDSYDDAQKSTTKFDLWSEAKDLSKEFRAYIVNGKIVAITERIANQENDKSVGKKDANEKINFVYIDIDTNKFEHYKQVESITNNLNKKTKLPFYAIDLMLDTDDNLWVPEINGAPGFTASTFYPIYKAWIKLIHKKDISESDDKELLNIRDAYINRMKEIYTQEYKKATNPL